MKTVDKETLRDWLGDPDLFLMDVRSVSAWNHSIAKIEHSQRFEPEKLGQMARDIPSSEVTPEAVFVDDLGADSLDLVELIMAMEEEFGMEIADEEAEKLRTVQDVISFVTARAA